MYGMAPLLVDLCLHYWQYFISSFPVSFQACLYLFLLWRTDWDKQAELVSDAFLQGIIEKSKAQHPSSNI